MGSDYWRHCIVLIDKETGKEIRVYHPRGQGNDSQHLHEPAGMVIWGDWLMVADSGNHRVLVRHV